MTATVSDSDASRPLRVAVVGGGITGLAAAQRLVSKSDAMQVTLFESSRRLGGIIRTEEADGFLIELGPDSFITNKPAGLRLCQEIGFTEHLIPTDAGYRRSLVLRNGQPMAVPDGFMLMAPAKPWAIMTTPVLSLWGKLRLLAEAFVGRKSVGDDESLASFVRRRFGSQALDRLVQPLVGGIYTSDPEKLSLKATMPRFLDMEQSHGSVIRATLAQEKSAAPGEGSPGKWSPVRSICIGQQWAKQSHRKPGSVAAKNRSSEIPNGLYHYGNRSSQSSTLEMECVDSRKHRLGRIRRGHYDVVNSCRGSVAA